MLKTILHYSFFVLIGFMCLGAILGNGRARE